MHSGGARRLCVPCPLVATAHTYIHSLTKKAVTKLAFSPKTFLLAFFHLFRYYF